MNSVTKSQILGGLFAVLLGAFPACDTQPVADATSNANPPTVVARTSHPELPDGWVPHSDSNGGFTFDYPEDLFTITTDSVKVILTHSVPHAYSDPCDFRDDAATLTALVDFEVTVSVVSQPVRSAIRRHEVGFQITDHLTEDGETLQPGYVDPVSIGARNGYRITHGVEGCGNYSYYLQEDSTRTIRLTRKIITEFRTDILTNADAFRAIPGIISPDTEDLLFRQLVASIRPLN